MSGICIGHFIIIKKGAIKMTRKIHFSLFLILCLSFLLYACDDEPDENSIDKKNTTNSVVSEGESWVFYWYLCGSDLESEYGCASLDLEELTSVALPENVSVVFEAGGAGSWYNDFNPEVLTRGIYNSEGMQILEELPSADMGEPEVLSDFLSYCNTNFPADHRAIIFWNHGGGSVAGAAFDEIYDSDSIKIPELIQALSATDTGSKYELIGFDACLMATIDVADACDEFADYLVASEEFEPGCGWSYDAFMEKLTENTSINGAELGKIICDSYYEGCSEILQEDAATLSVVDLSKIPELVKAYDSAGAEALIMAGSSDDSSYFNEVARCAYSSENYGGNNDSEGYTNMVDISDFINNSMKEELLPASGERVLTALDNAVIYKVNGPLRSGSGGLSCYYSYDGSYDDFMGFSELDTSRAFGYYFDYMLTGEPSEEMYDYALQAAPKVYSEEDTISELTPVTTVNSKELEDFPVELGEDGFATLNLGKETADNLSGIYFQLAYVDDENNMAIFLGEDNDLDSDWENGIFKDNFRGVWGSIDGCLVYMELSDESEDYQIYAVPVLLNSEEYVLSVSYNYASQEYKILGARKEIDQNGKADKFLRHLQTGDVIEPIHYVMPDLENSEDIQTLSVDKITVTDDTKFEEIELGDGKYFLMFEMKDMRNQSYNSQIVMFDVENNEITISN